MITDTITAKQERIEQAKKLRPDAINRALFSEHHQILDLESSVTFYKMTTGVITLVFIATIAMELLK